MKTMRVLIVFVVISVIPLFSMARGQDLSSFEELKEPRIITKKNQKMLVVEAKGDPNIVGVKGFGLVFRLYYTMKETPKGMFLPTPRARWPVSLDSPKSEWIGLYALPVPDNAAVLPQHETEPGIKASLTTWEYGDVAEILHVGPYDKEQPTVKRLKDFVKQQGYVIIGDHEEEYIKGPTMNSKGDPDKYMTILRYRVKKSESHH
ncbi:MAG: hypothetical protein GY940_28770 [bacterium]|nr:hypothetical protein [bacterium]